MASYSKAPRFTKEEETALHARMVAGDMEAKDLLASSVFPWGMKCGWKYSRRRLDEDEIKSLVGIAIARCLDGRWEPERGRLTTALDWSVRAEMGIHFETSQGAVHVPRYKMEDPKQLEDAARGRKQAMSLNAEIPGGKKGGDGGTLMDQLEGPRDMPLETLEHNEEIAAMRAQYEWAMRFLEARDREVLGRRHKGESLEEIAESFGLTKERIRQIELRADAEFKVFLLKAPNAIQPDWSQPVSSAVLEKPKMMIINMRNAFYESPAVLGVISEFTNELGGDYETALPEALAAIYLLPDFETLREALVEDAVRTLLENEDRRRTVKAVRVQQERNKVPPAPPRPSLAANIAGRVANHLAYQTYLRYTIRGVKLGSMTGKELLDISNAEAEASSVSMFHSELCSSLAKIVPANKRVRDVLDDAALKSHFEDLKRVIFEGDAPQQLTLAGELVTGTENQRALPALTTGGVDERNDSEG